MDESTMSEPATEADANVAAMSFEEAMTELERIVSRLEKGGDRLEDAIEAYRRGMALKRHCERTLQDAQLRIERISQGIDGTVRAEAMGGAAA